MENEAGSADDVTVPAVALGWAAKGRDETRHLTARPAWFLGGK